MFEELDEVYGSKASVNPPFLLDTAKEDWEIELDTSDHDTEETTNPLAGSESSQAQGQASTEPDAPDFPKKDFNSKKPSLKRKQKPEPEFSKLASISEMRFQLQQSEMELQKEKWEEEKRRQDAEKDLAWARFEHEKEVADKKLKLEEKKINNDFELEKYKIEMEMKIRLEMSKLN